MVDQSKELAAKADQLIIWLMNRIRLMEHFAVNPFTTSSYLDLVKNRISTHDRSYLKALNAIPNERFYEQLLAWRERVATTEKIMPNMVMTEKTMASVAEKLPATLKALGGIKGVGAQKAAQYGPELILMIRAYQLELQGSATDQASLF